MTTITDCLTAFSAAAMMNTPDAKAMGSATVDAHLEIASPNLQRRLASLSELYAPYLELALDSMDALAIRALSPSDRCAE